MFQSKTALPHLLRSDQYWTDESHEYENRELIRNSWHVVATTQDLKSHGDFVTVLVADTPVQVRNFDGELAALSNVCAHRNALICSETSGNSPAMQCQYHGWEYQKDGRTGKIPQPKNFAPIDRESLCIPKFSVEKLGQLVFMNLSSSASSLEQSLGKELYELIAQRFDEGWFQSLSWNPSYSANWKVPVENSLESYHVPNVHPGTFKQDPGAERSDHRLEEKFTSMETDLPFSPHDRIDATFQKLEKRVVRWMGHQATGHYRQYHVFPNLLFSFTDAISLVNCILPTSPQECAAIVRQFGRIPVSHSPIRSWFARRWAKLTASITKGILREDQEIFAAIQTGLRYAPSRKDGQNGVLGICEERIHRFQVFVENRLESAGEAT